MKVLKVAVFVFGALALSAVLIMRFNGPSDGVIRSLPKTSEVLGVYRAGGYGNGDYVYALKCRLSEESFLDFVESKGMSDMSIDPTTVIGFTPSSKDVPDSIDWTWNEPRDPQLKFYKKRTELRACRFHRWGNVLLFAGMVKGRIEVGRWRLQR